LYSLPLCIASWPIPASKARRETHSAKPLNAGIDWPTTCSLCDAESTEGELVKDGFYCHIRNPLFFFSAVFLWLSPLMTENLLAFNILATVYFYLGARHEEGSLQEELGEQYEDYRKKVPMFLPRMRG
jgi:protein-S-isoprenylcysteine O-methyltransferase Ste14